MNKPTFGIERKSMILSTLEKDGRVSVNTLSAKLNVCKETVRRDLREMEEDGLVKRTHGGAVSMYTYDPKKVQEYPYLIREIQNYEAKTMICRKAASFIENGDTIFVDNSSTNVAILKSINPEYSVTVVTNSIRLLLESTVINNKNISMISLGGLFREKNYSCTGGIADGIARTFRPNKAFLSCYGIDIGNNLYDSNINELDVKRIVLQNSKKVFLTGDHTKIGRQGVIVLSDFSQIDYLITDMPIPDQSMEELRRRNIEVIIANKI